MTRSRRKSRRLQPARPAWRAVTSPPIEGTRGLKPAALWVAARQVYSTEAGSTSITVPFVVGVSTFSWRMRSRVCMSTKTQCSVVMAFWMIESLGSFTSSKSARSRRSCRLGHAARRAATSVNFPGANLQFPVARSCNLAGVRTH